MGFNEWWGGLMAKNPGLCNPTGTMKISVQEFQRLLNKAYEAGKKASRPPRRKSKTMSLFEMVFGR